MKMQSRNMYGKIVNIWPTLDLDRNLLKEHIYWQYPKEVKRIELAHDMAMLDGEVTFKSSPMSGTFVENEDDYCEIVQIVTYDLN